MLDDDFVRSLYDQLDDASHREVVLETSFYGRSVAVTADILKIPIGTVKSRTSYAVRTLRLALEDRAVTR